MKGLPQKLVMLAAVLVMSAYGVMTLRGPNGISALAEKRRQIQLLQDKNASLAAENEHKKERIEQLRHSKQAQDLEIRKRLKLVRPGETQFILPEPRNEAQPEPAQSR